MLLTDDYRDNLLDSGRAVAFDQPHRDCLQLFPADDHLDHHMLGRAQLYHDLHLCRHWHRDPDRVLPR